MDKFKIALYTRSFPPKGGGIATSHFNIYNLLKKDYDIKVFVYGEFENSTTSHVFKRKTWPWLNALVMLLIKFKFRKRAKKSNFNNVAKIVNCFIPIMRLNKHLRRFQPDIILIADNFVPGYLLKKPKVSKLVCFAHHNYIRFRNNILLEDNDWLDIDVAHSMEQKAIRRVDAIISPSEHMISSYKDTTYKNKPIFNIPNFIEEKVLHSISNKTTVPSVFPKDKKVVYIPSAGSVVKGKRYVFEIIRRLASFDGNLHFYLSGTIPDVLSYELTQFKSKIYAPGHIKWEDNFVNVMQCYLAITPNLEENFSNAILEAQTVGVPFVAFDTGGNKEIIIDNITGHIVPYLDVEALIAKSIKVIQNEEMQKTLGKESLINSQKRFNSHVILQKYHAVLNEIHQLS